MTRDLSLGEVQALAMKATRGAGRAVGVAEDAGRAVRWLCARGADGAGLLAALLKETDGREAALMVPEIPALTPRGPAICPLSLGGYLSDMGLLPEHPLGPLWVPDLLRPFVADLAPMGVDVVAADDGLVQLVPRQSPQPATHSRADISAHTMARLLDFAARTYAPSTEASRAQGAGAGLSDND